VSTQPEKFKLPEDARERAEARPSDAARERVCELLRCEKSESLSVEDAAELGEYLEVEHMMRLAKARARQQQPHE
jgi:hypothetical protein